MRGAEQLQVLMRQFGRLSAVRWGVAGNIVWAWVLTIPASGLLAALAWRIGQRLF